MNAHAAASNRVLSAGCREMLHPGSIQELALWDIAILKATDGGIQRGSKVEVPPPLYCGPDDDLNDWSEGQTCDDAALQQFK